MIDAYATVLNRTLGQSIGLMPSEVIYRTYHDDGVASAVAAGIGWLDGEVVIQFPGVAPLYVGWGENAGWPDHFSLLPAAVSTYKPNMLTDFRALQAPEWAPLLVAPLRRVELLGTNGTPHLLILASDEGAVVIGDGRGRDLGDGDQILVRSIAQADVSQFTQSFWRVGGPAG